MTIRRTLATALAATAIAAPAASAQPADTHAAPAPAPAQEQQRDLRSPDAIDAAAHPRSAPPVAGERPATIGDEVGWATLGLGIAGLVLFTTGVVALATRPRPAPGVGA